MEMQPNTVEWKGLTDTQCPVCDRLLKGHMVRHIHQNHTECVTSGDAHLEAVRHGSKSKLAVNRSMRSSKSTYPNGACNYIKTCDQSPWPV